MIKFGYSKELMLEKNVRLFGWGYAVGQYNSLVSEDLNNYAVPVGKKLIIKNIHIISLTASGSKEGELRFGYGDTSVSISGTPPTNYVQNNYFNVLTPISNNKTQKAVSCNIPIPSGKYVCINTNEALYANYLVIAQGVLI
jgi:hypothetical protein